MQALSSLMVEYGLTLVFAVTLAARAGVPLPAAPLLVVAGGVAVATPGGLLALWLPALAVATLANVLGDGLWYLAGRRYGQRIMGLLCRFSLSPDSCVVGGASLMARHGGGALLAAKFVPGVSVVAAPMAGAAGMSSRRFLLNDTLASALWSALYLTLGAVFSRQLGTLLDGLAAAGMALAALAALGLAGFFSWRWWHRHGAEVDDDAQGLGTA
jgi:membrane protein DedA with SNARE-associated domain